jgi:hypothetical protein
MSPQVAQILQAIDRVASALANRLPLVEQTQLLRQLEQKIDSAYNNERPVSPAQQQWQQAINTIRSQTCSRSVSVRRSALEKQKARISDMFAKFNQDEDEIDQQEALRVINSIAKTSI